MKNEEIKRRYRSDRSQISRRMLLQYLLALCGFVVGYVILFFMAWIILSQFVWHADNLLYQILNRVKENAFFVSCAVFLVGWIFITYYFISKPLRYLDEVVDASEQLANHSEIPVALPAAMSGVQNELNLVREEAIRNAARAREAEQRKNDLVVYLAHDLKTPLTSVIGYLTLLRDEKEISEPLRQKYLSISLEKAERLENLINEFFDITRFNISNIVLEMSRVNLTRFLEQLVFEFKPMLLEKNLECTLSIAPDTMVMCDADKMQRVFDNLLRNAVFYSYENSKIDIVVQSDEREIVIKFTNRGKTIPKEKLERIFQQFYRLDTARGTNSGGAGLGLSIAKEIVELHQGRITARSQDETIEFEVRLPLS